MSVLCFCLGLFFTTLFWQDTKRIATLAANIKPSCLSPVSIHYTVLAQSFCAEISKSSCFSKRFLLFRCLFVACFLGDSDIALSGFALHFLRPSACWPRGDHLTKEKYDFCRIGSPCRPS